MVSAYKRLLQWWIINYYKKNNTLPEKYNPVTFQRLLENNIYGVDIVPKATLITIFSLTTAFLEKLDPIAFWENLNFTKLKENIQTNDFFQWATSAPKDFDLIIGNPPFNDQNNKPNVKITPELINIIGFKHPKVPENKYVFQFFEGAMVLGKNVCLIIRTQLLLYIQDYQNYQKSIFTDFTVEKVFDFTHLRRELLHADTPVCGIICKNKPSNRQPIEHIVVQRMLSAEQKTVFEINEYDRYFVQ